MRDTPKTKVPKSYQNPEFKTRRSNADDFTMFAAGHIACGYLLGKGSAKLLKVDINIPLLLALSVIPDIDILLPRLTHRGVTHSLIVITFTFVPFLILYGARALPYLIAVAQHAFFGDYLTGRSALFWPITSTLYGTGWSLYGQQNLILEWGAFLLSVVVMLKARDIVALLKPGIVNLLLVLPTTASLVTLFSHRLQPLPIGLIIPELAFLALCALSIMSPIEHRLRLISFIRSKLGKHF